MELKEYITLFKKQIKWFWATVILFVLISGIWQSNQPTNFEAVLLLNIGRTNVQNTENYTYDSFYRLQADERFADTVVRWLGSPRIVENIYGTVGIDTQHMSARTLKSVFGAKRLSSQMIEVTYRHPSEKMLEKISQATINELNTHASELNKENSEKNWFVVVGSDPVIRDVRVSLSFALALSLTLGVFIGFWVALVKHYFSDNAQQKTDNR
ncbi:MAG: hypothetical protein GW815_02280 [Candidatus Moranbacteria bacterium]|nr:hypothetical protein [Candidatus Moranbacteria bacterium]OIQ03501.1 MAG: hypothetical protein AUK58_01800 [Candidatus Moranbacteria bacterium CG2_30_41_165]PIP25298.1 MAG: hypothetical protein COX32_04395 [Candidatus Moranbacteria bacterium CG23_combo_of_CG06-09_8_20_14_all_41_28]PIV86582.1 MAG: hypothetical protein COW50_00685 [Candidatus Moranbacteria bacterium CG17_big_fil_post_rev_8_21_14_2_50_41_107]PIW94165.1 MAG: hypothetical protein COZ86_02385 [Candidatus Moranbacteria bacterium CG_